MRSLGISWEWAWTGLSWPESDSDAICWALLAGNWFKLDHSLAIHSALTPSWANKRCWVWCQQKANLWGHPSHASDHWHHWHRWRVCRVSHPSLPPLISHAFYQRVEYLFRAYHSMKTWNLNQFLLHTLKWIAIPILLFRKVFNQIQCHIMAQNETQSSKLNANHWKRWLSKRY